MKGCLEQAARCKPITNKIRTEVKVDEMPCLVRHIRPCKQAGGDIIVASCYVSGPAHTSSLQHDATGSICRKHI